MGTFLHQLQEEETFTLARAAPSTALLPEAGTPAGKPWSSGHSELSRPQSPRDAWRLLSRTLCPGRDRPCLPAEMARVSCPGPTPASTSSLTPSAHPHAVTWARTGPWAQAGTHWGREGTGPQPTTPGNSGSVLAKTRRPCPAGRAGAEPCQSPPARRQRKEGGGRFPLSQAGNSGTGNAQGHSFPKRSPTSLLGPVHATSLSAPSSTAPHAPGLSTAGLVQPQEL